VVLPHPAIVHPVLPVNIRSCFNGSANDGGRGSRERTSGTQRSERTSGTQRSEPRRRSAGHDQRSAADTSECWQSFPQLPSRVLMGVRTMEERRTDAARQANVHQPPILPAAPVSCFNGSANDGGTRIARHRAVRLTLQQRIGSDPTLTQEGTPLP
jgi:hypothetical protein